MAVLGICGRRCVLHTRAEWLLAWDVVSVATHGSPIDTSDLADLAGKPRAVQAVCRPPSVTASVSNGARVV